MIDYVDDDLTWVLTYAWIVMKSDHADNIDHAHASVNVHENVMLMVNVWMNGKMTLVMVMMVNWLNKLK